MTQPVITGAGEAVVSGGFPLLVFAAANQIDSLRQMFGDMGLVEDDLVVGIGKVLAGGLVGNPGQGERRFRDEAEQFQADSVTAFGFGGMISTGR